MIGTGVFTAVGRRRTGLALGWVMLLTLLMGSSASGAQILNPSLEATRGTPTRPLPGDWFEYHDPSCFNSWCSNTWKTDGTWSAALFSLRKKSVTPGKYEGFFQRSVDLTGIAAIKFDVRLSVLPSGGTFEHFEASFLVDGVPLWRQTAGGVYLDQEVNVAGLGAWRILNGHEVFGHEIEMRITALDASSEYGFDSAYWTEWDNLRLIEGQPTIPAIVTLDPGTLNPASNGKWITCYIELGQDKSGKAYDVSAIDGASVTLRCGDTDIRACTTGDQGWATAAANDENVADFDGDGVLERMVKFDRAAVQALVQPPEPATVSIQGRLAGGKLTNGPQTNGILTSGIQLEGKATIRVLDNKAKK
jgi:hypothetical protein